MVDALSLGDEVPGNWFPGTPRGYINGTKNKDTYTSKKTPLPVVDEGKLRLSRGTRRFWTSG